jgi:hypothetical protein
MQQKAPDQSLPNTTEDSVVQEKKQKAAAFGNTISTIQKTCTLLPAHLATFLPVETYRNRPAEVRDALLPVLTECAQLLVEETTKMYN